MEDQRIANDSKSTWTKHTASGKTSSIRSLPKLPVAIWVASAGVPEGGGRPRSARNLSTSAAARGVRRIVSRPRMWETRRLRLPILRASTPVRSEVELKTQQVRFSAVLGSIPGGILLASLDTGTL
eukprot:6171027-Prymnesium_polylepis.1